MEEEVGGGGGRHTETRKTNRERERADRHRE